MVTNDRRLVPYRLRRVAMACRKPAFSHKTNALMSGYRPWADILAGAQGRARRKGISFNLNDNWARERFTGYCEMTGIEFSAQRGKRNMFSMSLDRIEHAGGYTTDNCRFILWGLNAMRGANGLDADMLYIARELMLKAKISI